MSRQFEAVIFDLDGVICHTDRFHYLGWKSVADDLGVPFDEVANNRLRGVSRMESLEILLEKYDGVELPDAVKDELASTKNSRYREMLEGMTPGDLDPSVKSTLDELRGRGLKLGIGSSSANARLILQRIGLGDYFDAISDGTNIVRSKPDPEVFLKAAAFLGVEPGGCVVVEDALAGIEAGRAAGMYTIAVGDAADQNAGDARVETFSDLALLIQGPA